MVEYAKYTGLDMYVRNMQAKLVWRMSREDPKKALSDYFSALERIAAINAEFMKEGWIPEELRLDIQNHIRNTYGIDVNNYLQENFPELSLREASPTYTSPYFSDDS